MFTGFAPLTANFTLTPNQFFDVILQEEDCVVKVVGNLIRATLGWEDPRTKARRVEVSLPMSEFIARGMARNSVRKGLELAITRGYIIKTVEDTPKSPARYSLRWDDHEAQQEALRRERLANGEAPEMPSPLLRNGMNTEGIVSNHAADTPATTPQDAPDKEGRGLVQDRGSKFDPVKVCTTRGSKFDPPYIREDSKQKEKEKTLNVGPEIKTHQIKTHSEPDPRNEPDRQSDISITVTESGQDISILSESTTGDITRNIITRNITSSTISPFSDELDRLAEALAAELQDQDSVRRHRQLLGICENKGLSNLPAVALRAVRKRQEGKAEPLDRPGAYYQRILIGLLEEHQVFVPKLGEDNAEEVRRLLREGLGL